jgi:hypothetical protein
MMFYVHDFRLITLREQHSDADDVLIPFEECALVYAKWRNDVSAAGGEVKAG